MYRLTRLAPLLALLVLGLAPGLTACGFSPLYATRDGDLGASLANVSVEAPDTRLGRDLKYTLIDNLQAAGKSSAAPQYVVKLAPRTYEEDVAIQQDASVTRKNIVLLVSFTLTRQGEDKPLYSSLARSRTSYNRVDSEFANIIASEDGLQRSTEMVAEDIKLQLGVYFEGHRTAKQTTAK
ncbi:LPS assembly lipoprotein LptE [Parvibaculum sp.]|uniref:LPS assembly lipoprotein LptE n=1 Tax=Parvibaculum sp. TaxID=2024848 RepID=UPI0025F93CC1|nr:LPS assembly lipoprotein LptE [Parvibaculum sp.]